MRRFCMTVSAGAMIAGVVGCGSGGAPVSPACTSNPAAVQRALRAAPRPVALRDGTTLSRCISAATDDADMQNVGIAFADIAETLGDRARAGDDTAALQLGYLIGATRRGAAKSNGVLAELQRRIELVGGRVEDRAPARHRALMRGRIAGEATG